MPAMRSRPAASRRTESLGPSTTRRSSRAARNGETADETREEARAKGIEWLVSADCSGSPSQPRILPMELDRALAWSHYAQRAIAASPALGRDIAATVDTPFDWTVAHRSLDAIVAGGDSRALADELRRLRRRLFIHTLCRDLTGWADLSEVLHAITTLAETALAAATTLHTRELAAAS